jgi:hypothetical protein
MRREPHTEPRPSTTTRTPHEREMRAQLERSVARLPLVRQLFVRNCADVGEIVERNGEIIVPVARTTSRECGASSTLCSTRGNACKAARAVRAARAARAVRAVRAAGGLEGLEGREGRRGPCGPRRPALAGSRGTSTCARGALCTDKASFAVTREPFGLSSLARRRPCTAPNRMAMDTAPRAERRRRARPAPAPTSSSPPRTAARRAYERAPKARKARLAQRARKAPNAPKATEKTATAASRAAVRRAE